MQLRRADHGPARAATELPAIFEATPRACTVFRGRDEAGRVSMRFREPSEGSDSYRVFGAGEYFSVHKSESASRRGLYTSS